MLFNSTIFAVFLVIVIGLYWCVLNNKLKHQNLLLLVASYVFYGWWDWRFLSLLVGLSLFNYLIGILLCKSITNRNRKAWFLIGIVINIGTLVLFKYFHFFIDSFIDLISLIGYKISKTTTSIILPLGISFYIFLSLSYLIDIYREEIKAEKNAVNVLLALSFFPIILAGPIQRPASLIPQIVEKRKFYYEQAVDGLKQILWGLFSKVVIADRLSFLVDDIFNDITIYSGSTLLLGAVFFSIQIYADFSGYSNIAIGVARLLGFNIMQNFNYPYFSRNITEFWKRWHISLTQWFRDYVFLPLSFSFSTKITAERRILIKKEVLIYIMASFFTWLLTGLWHGANVTFIVWGLIHGFFLTVHHLQSKPRRRFLKKKGIKDHNGLIVSIEAFFNIIIIMSAWIFFRAHDCKEAITYISNIFSQSLFSVPDIIPKFTILSVVLFFVIEWYGQNSLYPIADIGTSWKKPVKYAFYYLILIAVIWFSGTEREFIYFQF